MTIRNTLALLLASLLVGGGCAKPAHSVRQLTTPLSPRSIDEVTIAVRNDVFWLADDARQGRGVGTEGLAQAGDFIAARFARFGLKPLPGLDGYFQYFDYSVGGKIGPDTRLEINGVPIPPDQFTGLARSKAGAVQGPLVFVGYGIKSAEHDYDDFAGIDVKDHVVLIMRWEPVDQDGKSRWTGDAEFSREAAIQRKVANAVDAGAKAVILVNAPTHHDDAERLMDSQAGLRRAATVPVFHLTIDAVNSLLAGADAPTLTELQAKIDESQKPASMPLDSVTVTGELKIEKDTSSVRNVVAYMPGKGPHANEFVVVGAHYDHIGMGQGGRNSGKIHNGADDNASGTTAMLQIAENFALTGQRDRSIVFIAFTLEEAGLIGSRKFVESNIIPPESIVAMLNLDMVGRMKDEHLYVGGGGTAVSFENLLKESDDGSPIVVRDMGKGGRGPSDHQSFSARKIPVLFFFSGMHPDYHAPGDDPEKINYLGIAQVVEMSFDLVRNLCEQPKQEYVATFDGIQPDTNVAAGNEPGALVTAREMIEPDRPRLGIVPNYESEPSDKGILISGVSDNTAAAAAGLKAGDIITQLNAKKIVSLEDVVEFLNESKVGEKVTIAILRDGQSMSLESTLKGRAGVQ